MPNKKTLQIVCYPTKAEWDAIDKFCGGRKPTGTGKLKGQPSKSDLLVSGGMFLLAIPHEARQMIFRGKYREAIEYADAHFVGDAEQSHPQAHEGKRVRKTGSGS